MENPSQLRERTIGAFIQQYPKIPCVIPSSPEYAALRATFIIDNPAVPIAIVRPQNADDVSTIVSFCVDHEIPFVVRSGGNNLFGKSQVHDALTIDMRDIKYCRVDYSKRFAEIGGGILAGKLVEDLSNAGVMTASGTVDFIGYVGWSTYGGYGPFSGNFGYGFEQILGAKVVNWKGEILDADLELLKGIRGAGGSFGIIVEMTIKVYPLTKILTGIMLYDASDVEATVVNYCQGLQKLRDEGFPRQLCVAPLFLHTGDGLKLASHFMWSDDDDTAGFKWLEKVSKLGKVLYNPVRKTTVLDGMSDFKTIIPPDGRASVNTVSLRALTKEVTAVMAKYVQRMPRYAGNGFAIHLGPKPSDSSLKNSVFGATESHLMLELLATPRSEEGVEESRKWGAEFLRGLLETNPKNILPTTYINLTPPGRTTLDQIYGANFSFVMALKRKYDPKDVLRLAVPFSYIAATDVQDTREGSHL
ncbi:hypothetical protein Plec18167_006109 [Paecilomyces lecythidis]|uniref:FAD-binding PCMH-type domain-containing protein n=1 Tax=Paecilomyces lecythidis TaxID=3004212 RepID=A0ABR3XEX7_9EURO